MRWILFPRGIVPLKALGTPRPCLAFQSGAVPSPHPRPSLQVPISAPSELLGSLLTHPAEQIPAQFQAWGSKPIHPPEGSGAPQLSPELLVQGRDEEGMRGNEAFRDRSTFIPSLHTPPGEEAPPCPAALPVHLIRRWVFFFIFLPPHSSGSWGDSPDPCWDLPLLIGRLSCPQKFNCRLCLSGAGLGESCGRPRFPQVGFGVDHTRGGILNLWVQVGNDVSPLNHNILPEWPEVLQACNSPKN